jgi:hypothetical protein
MTYIMVDVEADGPIPGDNRARTENVDTKIRGDRTWATGQTTAVVLPPRGTGVERIRLTPVVCDDPWKSVPL